MRGALVGVAVASLLVTGLAAPPISAAVTVPAAVPTDPNPQIPDRTFVDDLGRRWEWCGGQPGTWAWRITDEGQRTAIARVQASVLAALNTLGVTLVGPNFTPFESSPIPDADVAAMLDGLQITDRGRAVIESGLTLRQVHEIETGCTPDQLCDRCRKDIGEMA